MAKYKLLGRVQKNNESVYKVSDGTKIIDWSLDEFSYYLGRREVLNSVGYIRGIAIMIKAPEFNNEPINVLDIPIYNDPDAKSVSIPMERLVKSPQEIEASKRENETKVMQMELAKSNVAKSMKDIDNQIAATRKAALDSVDKSRSSTVSLGKKDDITLSAKQVQQNNINRTNAAARPPIGSNTRSPHGVFLQTLDGGLRKVFADCAIDIAKLDKNNVSQNSIDYSIFTSKNEHIILRLDLLGMINAVLIMRGKELIRSSYIANSDGAASLMNDIKMQLTRLYNQTGTNNQAVRNTDYMRLMHDVTGRIAQEVYSKINDGYSNRAVDVKYEVVNLTSEICGTITYNLLQNINIEIKLVCYEDSSFIIKSISNSDGSHVRVSRSRYAFTNNGVKQVYSDILSGILNSGVLDIGLEDNVLTKGSAEAELSKQLASITEELQLALTKQMSRVMAMVFVLGCDLKNTRYTAKGLTGTVELSLSNSNTVHIEMEMTDKEFRVTHVTDQNNLINYIGRYTYKVERILYDRIAVEIVDKLIECHVLY